MCEDEYEKERMEEMKKELMDHPCNKCGEQIYQKFPHPIFECGKDGHTAIMILDVLQMVNHLYEKCPLKESG